MEGRLREIEAERLKTREEVKRTRQPTQEEINNQILQAQITIDRAKALQERFKNPSTKPKPYKPSIFRRPPGS